MTSDRINNLNKLSLDFFNTKGDLLFFEYNNILRLLKGMNNVTPKEYQDHFKIINLLDKYRKILPSNFVLPDFLVRVDTAVKYFATTYINGDSLKAVLRDSSVSLEDKKEYLKDIGTILRKMDSIRNNTELSNFFLADIHEDNFIIDKNGFLHTIDLDGGKFSEDNNPIAKYLITGSLITGCDSSKYKVNMSNPYFTSYLIDRNTDIYCYCIIILNYLYNGNISNCNMNEFYNFLTRMNDIGIDKELIECFERLFEDRDNINPCDYIDTLTTSQVKKLRIK